MCLKGSVWYLYTQIHFGRQPSACRVPLVERLRDWHFIAERAAPAPHLAHPEGCAALRIVLVTVPRGPHQTIREPAEPSVDPP